MKNLICKVSSLKIKVFVLLVVLIFTNIPASFAADELYKKLEEYRKKYALLSAEASLYRNVYSKLMNSKKWLVHNTPTGPMWISPEDCIKYITCNYVINYRSNWKFLGNERHEKELAKRIKFARDSSIVLKKKFEKSIDKMLDTINKDILKLEQEYADLPEESRRTVREEVIGSKQKKDWRDDLFDIKPMDKKDKEMFGGAAGPTPAEKK